MIRGYKEHFDKSKKGSITEKILLAKQALLISMLYLKYITHTQPQLIISKKNK